MKTSWKNLKYEKPPVRTYVELAHIIMGVGAPEREGWYSIGMLNNNGRFIIKQNKENTVDFRPPTHWKPLID